MSIDAAWYHNVYLRTDYWERRKAQYFSTHDKRCEACSRRYTPRRLLVIKPIYIVLHHKDYENLWNEPDEDLAALCNRCHRNVHDIDRSGKFRTLRESTNWWIEKHAS